MDQNIRKVFAPAFKVKVALEAVKEIETTGQLASRFSVHPTKIGVWKKKMLEGLEHIFLIEKTKRIRKTNTFVPLSQRS